MEQVEKMEFSTGEHVFCEVSSEKPFQIFCIERIEKDNRGLNITIRRFYRRIEIKDCETRHDGVVANDSIKFRELLGAESTRSCNSMKVVGKCRVDFLLGFENLASYLEKEDCFFYSHYYDPKRQYFIPLKKIRDMCPIDLSDDMQSLETPVESGELMWDPNNHLMDEEVDCFVDVVRRYNNTNSHKFNRMDASSRAHNILNSCKYSMFDALFKLMNDGESVSMDDQIWSEEDTKKFEGAVRFCRKNFHLMQRKYFPDKSVPSLVDFYFKWKSPKLGGEWKKQVEIENAVTLQLVNPVTICEGTVNCENCSVSTSGWQYASAGKSMKIKVCQPCWLSWKKYGQITGSLSPDLNDLKDVNVEVDDVIDEVQESEEDEDYEPPMKKVRSKVEQRNFKRIVEKQMKLK